MSDISAVALFCEDIREEKSNQHSIVGVFGDYFVVPSVPGVVPKLAIYIRAFLPSNSDPSLFEVYLKFANGEEQRVTEFPMEIVTETIQQAKKSSNPIAGLYGIVLASPFTVESFGRMDVELRWSGNSRVIGGINFIDQLSV